MLKSVVLGLSLSAFLTAGAQAAEVTVSAAASLTNAFKQIAENFQQQYPEHRVNLNFAGSGALLAQIAKGAPVDVFASADQKTMDMAAEQQLISNSSRHDFVKNTLVIITPKGSKLNITQLDDLKQPQIGRLAVSNPDSVPVGRYSKAVLSEQQLWQPLANKIINTQHVRQSLDYVARDEVDAGFVYATDAAIMRDKVVVAYTVPLKTEITYPIALTLDGAKKPVAQQFLDFIAQPSSQTVLADFGFSQP